MTYLLSMSAISAVAIGNSLFFAIWLWLQKRNTRSNKLISLLLLALALRISKSVIVIAFPEAPLVFPAIGLTGMAAIGPLLYVYVRSLFGHARFSWFHFLPSVFIAGTVAFIEEAVLFGYYQGVVLQLFIYIVLTMIFLKNREVVLKNDLLKKEWAERLTGGVFLIWGAFLYQLFADTFLSYIIATAIAVLVLYVLSFWSMRHGRIFSTVTNGGNSDLQQIARRVDEYFRDHKVYFENNLTIESLSARLRLPAHQVSRAINEVYHKTFPEYLNEFRIEEAKKRLSLDTRRALSMESVAYDSGFNTLSTFYSTFRKFVKMTPAEYRKKST